MPVHLEPPKAEPFSDDRPFGLASQLRVRETAMGENDLPPLPPAQTRGEIIADILVFLKRRDPHYPMLTERPDSTDEIQMLGPMHHDDTQLATTPPDRPQTGHRFVSSKADDQTKE